MQTTPLLCNKQQVITINMHYILKIITIATVTQANVNSSNHRLQYLGLKIKWHVRIDKVLTSLE